MPVQHDLRVLVLLEARTLTGPAKNLCEFFSAAHAMPLGRTLAGSLVLFRRRGQPPPSPQLLSRAAEAGLGVHEIEERWRFDPRALARLGDIGRRVDPHILQSHSVKSHALIRAAGLRATRPWIAFHHGYTRTDLKVRVYNALDRWSLRAADLVVTTSRPFARQLARQGACPHRIRVLHNAVAGRDLDVPPALSHDGELSVLTVGRLSREKGHDDLLRAVAGARRAGVRVSLVVAGDGPERRALERLAAGLGIEDAVTFRGHVDDVRPLYASADVFALPSHSEGSPNALLEAMAAGLAVVATGVGGVPEIAEHGRTALLVPPRQPRPLALALRTLALDAALRRSLGAAARSEVLAHHGVEARARAVLQLYDWVLRPAGRPLPREVA